MTTSLLIIRHGETTWNAESRLQGHQDAPLSERGRRQARQLAIDLADEPLDAVYASDLQRAAHTAAPLASAQNKRVICRESLREWHLGAYEGLTTSEVKQKFKDGFTRFRRMDPDFQVPGGETYRQFYSRCLGGLTQIAGDHPGGKVAVFTHGGVIVSLLRKLHGIDMAAPDVFAVGNACVTRVHYSRHGWLIPKAPLGN